MYNLDPSSAYYDPKTRSMRENPFNEKGDKGKKYVKQIVSSLDSLVQAALVNAQNDFFKIFTLIFHLKVNLCHPGCSFINKK